MQNFMMVWSRNQDMKSGETCSFLAKKSLNLSFDWYSITYMNFIL